MSKLSPIQKTYELYLQIPIELPLFQSHQLHTSNRPSVSASETSINAPLSALQSHQLHKSLILISPFSKVDFLKNGI